MWKRALSLLGTLILGAVFLLGLMWFISSDSVVHAEAIPSQPMETDSALGFSRVPSGCVEIDSDFTSDTTWTGSCYHVMTTTVTIHAGVTLTINPPSSGTAVYFEEDAQLQVLGDLQAQGTASRPITFTTDNVNTRWVGIIIDSGSSGDLVEYAIIEYAQTGVKINDNDYVTLRYNTLRYNHLDTLGGGAVIGDTDHSTIAHNTVYSCYDGIVLNESFGNDISENTIHAVTRYGVGLVAESTIGGDGNLVASNEIYDCGSHCVNLEMSDENDIIDNAIYDCGGDGVKLITGTWNILQGNAISQSSGAGIRLDHQGDISVTENHVAGNALTTAMAGVVITNTSENVQLHSNQILDNGSNATYIAAVYIGDMRDSFNQLVANGNVISDTYGAGIYYAGDNRNDGTEMQNNAICSRPSFELDNQRAGHSIEAQYGWWGTNTPIFPENVNGTATIAPWITLTTTSVPTAIPGNLGATATLQVAMNDGTGHIPPVGARQVRLTTNAGSIAPSVITLDDTGRADATLTLTEIPPVGPVIVSATAFCDFVVTAPITIERTNVAIGKSVDISQTIAGDHFAYHVFYTNTTAVTATQVSITDALPVSTTWVADTADTVGWTRSATTPQPIWTRPFLAPGAHGSFLLTVSVSSDATSGLLLNNVVTIGTTTAELTSTDNVASAGPVEVIRPSVAMTKTGELRSKEGYPATYQIQVVNTSRPTTAPDMVCTITDPMLGISEVVNLSSGHTHMITTAYTVPVGAPDPLVNTAHVTCSPLGFSNVYTATDSHSVNLFYPSIDLDKAGDGLSKIGDPVDYTITLTNTSTSDTPDMVCTITDPMLGISEAVTLPSGVHHTLTAAYTLPVGAPDPLVNTAHVTCSPLGFTNELSISDTHTVNLFYPDIQVRKRGPAIAYVDEPLTYTFRITNTTTPTDSPPLILDSAVDDVLGDLSSAAHASGCGYLSAGDVCAFTARYTPMNCVESPLTNTLTVHYHPQGFPNDIDGSDNHTVIVECPTDLNVEKDDDVGSTSPLSWWLLMQSYPASPIQRTQYRSFVGPGDLITYTVFVQNEGMITATHIVLTDTLPLYTSYVGYGWQQVGTTRQYTMPMRDLPPGDIEAVRFVVRVDDPLSPAVRSIINKVAVGSAEYDVNDDNNLDWEDSPVRWVALDVHKIADPTTVRPGEQVTFTVVVTNLGQAISDDNVSSGITITDALPDGFTWITDTASEAGLERLSTQLPVWRTPTMTLNERISFTVTANVTTEVDTADCLSLLSNWVTASVSLDGQLYEWSSEASVRLDCLADLFVTKNDDVDLVMLSRPELLGDGERADMIAQLLQEAQASAPQAPSQHRSFVFPGDLVTYTITVINTAPYTATDVVLTETLPLSTEYVGYGWTFVGGRTYTYPVGTLPPLAWRILPFVVRVTDTLPSGVFHLTNLVCGGSAGEDLNPNDNCRYEDTPVKNRPSLAKAVGSPQPSAGAMLTFTISYTNPNNTALEGALITDTLPPDADWQYDTATLSSVGWTRTVTTDGQIAWQKSELAANEAGRFVVGVIISPTSPALCGQTLTNVITLTVLNAGQRYLADTAAASFNLDCSVDLEIEMGDRVGGDVAPTAPATAQSPLSVGWFAGPFQATQTTAAARDFVRPGDLITYTFRILNNGWMTATDVVLSDTLPLYTTYVDRGVGWRQVGATRFYTISLPDLSPGEVVSARFTVRVDETLPAAVRAIENYACVYSAEPESDPLDNCQLEETPVLNLVMNKVADAASVQPGQRVDYTISLANLDQLNGFDALDAVTVTDALPLGFSYIDDTAGSAGLIRVATQPDVVWRVPTSTFGTASAFTLTAQASPSLDCGQWMTNVITMTIQMNGHLHDWVDDVAVWIPCPIDLLVQKDDSVGPDRPRPVGGMPSEGFASMIPLRPLAQHRPFVQEGDLVTYTVIALNVGTHDITGVVLTETLPLYTDYVGWGWTHVDGRIYTRTVGPLAPGEGRAYYFVVRVHDTLPPTLTHLINRVCGDTVGVDQYPDNNCNIEDTPVRRKPLQVTKTAEECIEPGDSFNYTITYQNITTDTTFHNVLVTDTLDPNVSYIGGADWLCNGQVCSRIIPTITAGVSGTLILEAQLDMSISSTYNTAILPVAQPTFTNTVGISGGNRFLLVTPVDISPDLSVVKNDNVGPLPLAQRSLWNATVEQLFGHAPLRAVQQREFVRPGELITYTILYVNTGDTTAVDVVLTERLPDYTVYVGGGWTRVGATRAYTRAVGDVPPGGGGELAFIVRVDYTFPPNEDRVINRVDIASGTPECNLDNNHSHDDTPVRPLPLQVFKTVGDCILPGDDFTYQVIYHNTTTDTTFTDVVLSDTLDLYVIYTGGPEWSCAGKVCSRTIPSISPGERVTLPLPVRLSAAFPYPGRTLFTNTVAIEGGNRHILITSIDTGPDLAIVKNDNVGPAPPGVDQREVVSPGQLITYTVAYANGGLGTATDVVLTETLPLYTIYAGGDLWQAVGGGQYTHRVGDLAPGQGGSLDFVVRVTDTLPAGVQWIVNLVEIGSETPECDTSDNWSSDHTPLGSGAVPTFTLNKIAPASAPPCNVFTYTIVTVNNGPPASGVTLSDQIPFGTTYVPGSCTYRVNGGPPQPCNSAYPDPSSVMWEEDLDTGDRVVTTFSVHALTGSMSVALVENYATLDWGTGTISDSASTMVHDPSLEKTGPPAVDSGEQYTYTIVVENTTDVTIVDASLSDQIPFGTTYVPDSCTYSVNGGPPQSCDPNYPYPSSVMWQGEDLAPGERATTTFSVVATTGSMGVGTVENCATLDWGACSASDCWSTRVDPTDLILTKDAPGTVCPNDVITYTIVASNPSSVTVSGVSLTDPVPNGAIYVPNSCSCRLNGGPAQPCGPPPNIWQGDLAPGDQLTCAFNVTVNAGTMGFPVFNCAALDWDARHVQACASTLLVRCGQRLYVANMNKRTVDVFGVPNFEYIDPPIPVGDYPFGLEVDENRLFVADFNVDADEGRVYIIDTQLDRVADSPHVGAHPIHLAAYDGQLYVSSHSGPPPISVYDYVTEWLVEPSIYLNRANSLEFGFFGATADEVRGCVYMTKRDFGGVGIWRICPPSTLGPWTPELVYPTSEANREKPSSILYHPETDLVYVTFGLIDELWVLDPDTWHRVNVISTGVQDPTDPGFGGHGLAALGRCVFVSNYLDQSVTAYGDGSCVESATAAASQQTAALLTMPVPYQIYLPLITRNFSDQEVDETLQGIATIPLSGRPKGMDAGADHFLFVTLPEDGNGNPFDRIAVIDTRSLTVVHEIQVLGDNPHPHTVILVP